VEETELVERSLARLVRVGEDSTESTRRIKGRNDSVDSKTEREEVWWRTWREMGFEYIGEEVWPVGKMTRRSG
jgi:hypothetical protein